MSHLAMLQSRFQDYLLDSKKNIDDLVADGGKVPKPVRLGIYADGYRVRLVEASTADFTHLRSYLGDTEFEKLINAYLAVYPSRHFSLRWFGQHLCRFLAETQPYAQHPDLLEMALFEWALCAAFDATDVAPVSLNELAVIPAEAWQELTLSFHPALRVLSLAGNIPDIWSALNDEKVPPEFVSDATKKDWLVWRHELRLLFRPLQQDEATAFASLQAGENFGAMCEGLCVWHAADEVPLRAVNLLKHWIEQGLVTELH